MEKKAIISLTLIWILNLHISFAQNFEWARSFGGTQTDNGVSITTDNSGNVYTTGSFRGNVDFDPGTGVTNLISKGREDIFVQKLDSLGNFVWARNFGGTSLNDAAGNSITVDNIGNIYVTGQFEGTVDFDPGVGVQMVTSSSSLADVFTIKMDPLGNLIWVISFGANAFDSGESISVDQSGNVLTTGTYRGTVDFDPSNGINNSSSLGFNDIFVHSVDSMGNFLWVKTFGGTNNELIKSTAIDKFGNIYNLGNFESTVDFDPGIGVSNLVAPVGYYDQYIQKLDSVGNFIWVKHIVSSGMLRSEAITTDPFGNVYTAGSFENTVDFDPGSGVSNLTASGAFDAFIQKLDSAGNFLFVNTLSGSSVILLSSIVSDDIGNIYTTGGFSGTVDFNPRSGVFNLSSVISFRRDIFVQKMNPMGDFLWANSFNGASSFDDGLSIHIDHFNNVLTTGNFGDTVDFDPSNGTANLTSLGGGDVFIQKMSQCMVNSIDTQTVCGQFTWMDGNTYTTSNQVASFTLRGTNGCDSLITLNLTILPDFKDTTMVSSCGSFVWPFNGVLYNSSGIYSDTLTASNGCDSITYLDLTISNSKFDTLSVMNCGPYSWSATNTTYNVSGNYNDTNITINGCDSITILSLTIDTTNNGISQNGFLLSSNQTGASYQWLDCNNNNAPITGDTLQSYTATSNGSYAVEVTLNGCVDTSACVLILNVGVNEQSAERFNFKLYPNPNKGLFTIELNESAIGETLQIMNLSGSLINTIDVVSAQQVINLSDLSNGVYFVRYQNSVKKFILSK